MALTIENNHGIFEINGKIHSENVRSLQNYFECLIDISDSLIISIENVKKIDISGVNALGMLYKKAMKGNKALSIIGKDNKNIQSVFKHTKMNFILKNDFV
ncbi:STAS domain-containing protein [Aquimarina rhabdastrellae]